MERKVEAETLIKEKTESYIKMEIKIPYTIVGPFVKTQNQTL